MENKSEKSHETRLQKNEEKSSERKLRIKVKCTKVEESVVDKDPVEAKSGDHVRVFDVCKRVFTSWKALGGHLRVHSQGNLGGDLNKLNRKSINSSNKSQHLKSLSENYLSCSLCGKSFSSLKSLCGHMRCHPERECRGIQPPQTGHSSSSSSVCYERESSLPCWLTKAKRGRQSLIHVATSSSMDADREVAYDLMMLSQGKSTRSELTSQHKIEDLNSDSINTGAGVWSKGRAFESKKQRIKDLGYGTNCKKLKINEFNEKNSDDQLMTSTTRVKIFPKKKLKFRNLKSTYYWDGGTNNNAGEKGTTVKKSKFRDLKLVENENEDHGDDNIVGKRPMIEHKCNTCNKCFPSYQALGGHRSSHNNSKITNISLLAQPDSHYSNSSSNRKKPNMNNVSTHQCSICHKIFPTGQALGGHKRCHWDGPAQEPVSSQATSSQS